MEDVFFSFSFSLSALDIVDLFFLRILAAGIGPVKDPPFFHDCHDGALWLWLGHHPKRGVKLYRSCELIRLLIIILRPHTRNLSLQDRQPCPDENEI